MAEPRGKKPSSRLGKLMARFSDPKDSTSNKSLTKRASLKRLKRHTSSSQSGDSPRNATPGWEGLSDSPRNGSGHASPFSDTTPKVKAKHTSEKEITSPKVVVTSSNGSPSSGDDRDEEKSMSTVLPRNMKCVRLSHSLAVRGTDGESPKSSEFPIVKDKHSSSSSGKDSEGISSSSSSSSSSTHQKISPLISMDLKADADRGAGAGSSGDSETDESTFHEESASSSSASPAPRSAQRPRATTSPASSGRSSPVPVDKDGFATPTQTMRSSSGSNTPRRAKSRSANQAPPSSLQDSMKRTPNVFSTRKSSYESALAMSSAAKRLDLGGRKPKNADMEELDTLRRGTNMGKLTRSLTETWGKRVAEAEKKEKSPASAKPNTLGAPKSKKSKMKRSPSLVLRAMSQRYLETAKSETEFKRRKSEFSLRRKAGIRTLDEEKKKQATVIIEKNMVHKAKVGKEGMLSDYIQACDPAHLQDLIDRGLIEAQATTASGEIDVSKIESNEFNLNNNEFMGRLGREQFEDKVHEIVDFIAEHKEIKILSLTNAGVDTYFGIQIARMMMENSHITELNLESNDIYEQGIELMAEVLNKNKSLKILKLTNQKRYPSHVAKNALIKALENNHDIIRFSYDFMTIQQNDLKDKYLHRNQKWSRHKNKMAPTRSPTMVSSRRRRTVMERVSTAKQNSELDLALQRYSHATESHSKFDLSQMSSSFRRLTDLQMVETIGKIEAIMKGNTFIERVLFKNSGVKDDLARVIAKCLATNDKVRELNLEANDLSSEFLIELTEILSENTALQVLNVRHQRKDPSRAVATAFVNFLEKNHSILKMGFKFTQTRQEHLKERYLKRNAKEWRTQRVIQKAREAERQRMLEAQEAEIARMRGDSQKAKEGELQPTLGGLTDQVKIDTTLSPPTSPLISPLTSPVARDRRGRPLSWGGTMELELDKLMPATPKHGSRAATPSSPSAASVASDVSAMSPAATPRAHELNAEETKAEAEENPSKDEANASENTDAASSVKSKPVPLSAQPSFTQISLNFSALATGDDDDEDGDEAEDGATPSGEEAAAEADGDAPATMDSDSDNE